MKRFLLFLLFLLSLTGLQANCNCNCCLFDSIKTHHLPNKKQIAQTDSNLAPHSESKTHSPSDDTSTLTLVVNQINNILASANNLVAVCSFVLSLITIILAVLGIIGLVRLRKNEKKFEDIKRHLDYQQEKDNLKDLYMSRINDWMLDMNSQLADILSSNPNHDSAKYQAYNKSYRGYYFTKLSVTNIPNEKKMSEEKTQAINDIQGAINQIVEQGDANDLEALQEMAKYEINKEKKKMLDNAAKDLQKRLTKKE